MEEQNIKVLLLNIKTNIVKVESNQYTFDTLKEIEKDFLNVIELIKLFLISRRDTYYGYFMMNMRFQVNFKGNFIAGIGLNQYPPVFSSNPLILCKWTLQEIIYTICHEIEHVILNHPSEMVKCNPRKDPAIFKRFNIAADASVNDRLDDEIAHGFKFMVRPKGVINSSVLGKMFNLRKVKKMENYLYYYNLIKDKEVEEDQPQMMISGLNGGGVPTDQFSQSGAAYSNKLDDNNSQNQSIGQDSQGSGSSQDEQIITSDKANGLLDHGWNGEDEEYDDIFANVKEFINQSFKMINSESRGLMPSNFISEVEKINEPPKISWTTILKKYVGTISADRIHTRTRLNRRQPERFDLSGKINDKTLKIIVAIDTSGSVSDNEVVQIFNEIFAIIAKRKYEITVIECDAAIQRIYKIKKPSDVQLNVLGRGGTSFRPVINYINQEKYFRDALLIYFTDGYGDQSIPKPLTYRNIWVITDGPKEQLSLKEPYGYVISMME